MNTPSSRKLVWAGTVLCLVLLAGGLLLGRNWIPSRVEYLELAGPYLGQVNPGSTAERFAPELLSGEMHTSVVFSPDGKEVYWTPISEGQVQILFSRSEGGRWTTPQVVPFGSKFGGSDNPAFSPDGSRLFFTSWRPLKWYWPFDTKERIWFVERAPEGWSRPQALDQTVNALDLHWQLSLDDEGSLYFASGGDIWVSEIDGGSYQPPQVLGSPINSSHSEGHPWIGPAGDFLLFSSNRDPGSPGDYDLYFSRRAEDGSWQDPVNLGELVNTPSMELFPVVSADQTILFFLSNRAGGLLVYWIDLASLGLDLPS